MELTDTMSARLGQVCDIWGNGEPILPMSYAEGFFSVQFLLPWVSLLQVLQMCRRPCGQGGVRLPVWKEKQVCFALLPAGERARLWDSNMSVEELGPEVTITGTPPLMVIPHIY